MCDWSGDARWAWRHWQCSALCSALPWSQSVSQSENQAIRSGPKGVSINGGTPIAGWFIRENPRKLDDDWGYPHLRKAPDWTLQASTGAMARSWRVLGAPATCFGPWHSTYPASKWSDAEWTSMEWYLKRSIMMERISCLQSLRGGYLAVLLHKTHHWGVLQILKSCLARDCANSVHAPSGNPPENLHSHAAISYLPSVMGVWCGVWYRVIGLVRSIGLFDAIHTPEAQVLERCSQIVYKSGT